MRRRYVYRTDEHGTVHAVEVTPDFQAHPERSGNTLMVDRWLEGSRTTDGVDIGSRRKMAEYMRATGVAHFGDYTQSLAKAEEKRQEWRAGKAPVSRELAEQIGRTAHELSRRRK